MERSIATLKVNTIKNETRTQNDIKKRTKENTQLLVELNSIKLEVKKLNTEIEKKRKQYAELEIEISQLKKQMSLNRIEDERISKPMLDSRPDSSNKPRGMSAAGRGKASESSTPFMMQRRKEQQQTQFATSTGFGNEDKARINELTRQVDENNQQILLQRLEIRQLKDQIIRLLEGAGIASQMNAQQPGMNYVGM